jgi:acetolactate synthase-1/2/3 large subunit
MTTTAEAIVQTMIDAGVKRIFTLPGLGVSRTLDKFFDRQDEIEVLLCRTEMIASVMAQTTGRLTGKPGVFMGQGPFASSLGAFGIMEAHMSGSPMVILTDDSDYDGYGQYGIYQGMTGEYGGSDVKSSKALPNIAATRRNPPRPSTACKWPSNTHPFHARDRRR